MHAPLTGRLFGRSLLTHALAVIALAIGLAAPAHAQGTRGVVPDPISSRDLESYSKRLGLSAQQREAIVSFHDQYQSDFKVLRDTDIEKAVAAARGWQNGPFSSNFNRKEVEQGVKDIESVINKVKTLDNGFLDQVQSVLSEDQLQTMQGVRQGRDRVRYRAGVTRFATFIIPGVTVDLSDIYYGLDLSPDEKLNAGPLVSSYESNLTSATKRLHDDSITITLDMVQKMEAASPPAPAEGENQRPDRWWREFRPILNEANEKLSKSATELTDLNRKSAKSISAVLTPERGRELKTEFYTRAYQDALPRRNGTSRAFDAALKLSDITEEQRQAITAMAAEYRAASDRFTDQLVELIDENRSGQSPFNFDQEKRRAFEEKADEVREKRSKLAETALANLKALLGPELTEQIEQRVAEARSGEPERSVEIAITTGGPGGGAVIARANVAVAAEEPTERPDPFVPGPISRHNTDSYAAWLQLSDSNKVILSGLHEDYMSRYNALQEQGEIKAVREAQRKLWSMEPNNGEIAGPTPEGVENLYSLRKKALSAVISLDESFFTDVKTALVDKEQAATLSRIMLSRQRDIYNTNAEDSFGGGMGGGGRDRNREGRRDRGGPPRAMRFMDGGDSAESSIDLAGIAREADIKPADAAKLDAALLEYEQAATAAFQKSFESSMRMQLAMDKMMAEMPRAEGDGRARGFEGFQQVMETDGRAAREARQAVTTLNRASLEKVSGALDATQAQELRRAYNRKAYADVYRDRRSAEPRITAAMALDDLDAQQRTSVQELAVEFHAAYDQICEKMVELAATAPQQSGPPEARDWQAMESRRRDRDKLQYERNEVSDKAVSRLKNVLNESQLARIGPPPESEQNDRDFRPRGQRRD